MTETRPSAVDASLGPPTNPVRSEEGMTRAHRRGLGLLLTLSVGLNAFGLGWGLPGRESWAPDEVVPTEVVEGMALGFSGGWYSKYPPLHYYLLAVLVAPALRSGSVRAPEGVGARARVLTDAVNTRLSAQSRGLSVLMAAGMLVAVFMAGRMLLGPTGALLAAALVAGMPPFAFYAKLANLDVPALFWWAVSLVFLLRVLRWHRTRDYLLLAATAVAAVCTKDQTYGLYVLCVPWILASRARHDGRPGWRGAFAAALRPGPLLGTAFAALLFAAIHGLWWNADGFRGGRPPGAHHRPGEPRLPRVLERSRRAPPAPEAGEHERGILPRMARARGLHRRAHRFVSKSPRRAPAGHARARHFVLRHLPERGPL